ncbi:MAG: hypothetical protein HC927_07885 [Deltaproteobacteria bacterium]|nr:hypothetical protein [Deltaproteobacteria bacterium]
MSGHQQHANVLHFPSVEDHLVEPEVTRNEMVRGRLVVARPAGPSHAIFRGELVFLIEGHVVDPYTAAVEMLTRVGPDSDIAADVAILREGVDPSTGTRYLEELVFEVVSDESPSDISERAEEFSKRGVRRVIAIFIENGEACEWDRSRKDWRTLPLDGEFSDPTLVRPFPVRALFDAKLGANAVVEALDAKGNPALARIKARARAEGFAQGMLQGLRRAAWPKAHGRAERGDRLLHGSRSTLALDRQGGVRGRVGGRAAENRVIALGLRRRSPPTHVVACSHAPPQARHHRRMPADRHPRRRE